MPARVWSYTLGGYQVIKKWLSYREHDVLGRALKPDETAYVSEMVRRIAAILLLGRDLDKNYAESRLPPSNGKTAHRWGRTLRVWLPDAHRNSIHAA